MYDELFEEHERIMKGLKDSLRNTETQNRHKRCEMFAEKIKLAKTKLKTFKAIAWTLKIDLNRFKSIQMFRASPTKEEMLRLDKLLED